jgi:hypothetical protein
MPETVKFRRGLSEDFLAELRGGRFSAVLEAAASRCLDVQIREDYIDVYADGCCVLKLEERPSTPGSYWASIHHKYLDGLSLDDGQSAVARGNYRVFNVSPAFIDTYTRSLDAILGNAGGYVSREAAIEEQMIRHSLFPPSPVLFIDRQVQVHGIRRRADLIGVTTSRGVAARVVLVELKQGLDNRIQDLMKQMRGYRGAIAPHGWLHADVAACYRTVVAQKRELGLLPREVAFPDGRPSVECLFVLSDYNPKSRLLGRLREEARKSSFGVKLILLDKDEYVLPPADSWEAL